MGREPSSALLWLLLLTDDLSHPWVFKVYLYTDTAFADAAGLVKERPLDQWKETLAVLCSHSNSDEFQGLCDALARRLSGGGLTHAATLCWICASKVDQALHVWAKELLGKQASVGELQVRAA